MKDGLFYENGELIYYVNGNPKHAGVIKIGNDIYYISSKGRAVKGEHVVHGDMANGIIKRGTYTFGEDYKLVKGSRVAPKRSKKKKKKKVLTKKQKVWTGIVSGLLLIAILVFIAYESSLYEHKQTGGKKNDTEAANEIQTSIVLPEFDEKILLCSQQAKDLYDGNTDIVNAVKSGNPYCPLRFEYKLENESGTLLISENEGMTNAREFFLDSQLDFIDIDNLKTGTHYYYTVTVGDDEYRGDFETEKSTRFVKIPGTFNTRDIGGYTTLDGKTVKQGLLIRGIEIDGLVEAQYYIPNKYIDEVQDTFGFVYDFDLRASSVYSGDYSSKLGETVGHTFYNSPQYGGIFNELSAPTLRHIFSDLADKDKYPMYFHCTYGTDRTGTIIYLLQGLLGIPAEEMENEYKRTGFWNRAIAESHNIEVIEAGMSAYQGDTLQQKIENFLMDDVGVTKQEIESIRSIFLED